MKLPRPKKKRTYVLVGILLVILVAGVWFFHELTKPSQAAIITTSSAPTPQTTQTSAPPVTVHGTYASFTYPGALKPVANQPSLSGGELAEYEYKKSDVETWYLVISISRLGGPTLMDDSGYLLRKNNPSQYQANTLTYGDNTFIIMTDTQATDFNEVAFSLHGNISGDISLTGDDGAENASLKAALEQVLSSWQWQ